MTTNNNNILNSNNVNSVITNNITSSTFFSDFDCNFISVLDEMSRLDDSSSHASSSHASSIELDYSRIFPPSQTDSITQMLLSPQDNISQASMEHLYSLIFPSSNTVIDDESLYETNPIKKVISKKGKTQLTYLKYTKECNNHTCPILCTDFTEGEDIIALPCQHCFYPKAIETWLNKEKAECPVCRFQLDYTEKNMNNIL